MLFEPERHEQVTSQPWDERLVREAIERIFVDACEHYRAAQAWPAHPLDGPDSAEIAHSLYAGATGVIWGLDQLHRLGLGLSPKPDFARAMESRFEDNRRALAGFAYSSHGLLCGDAGILLVDWKLSPCDRAASLLAHSIDANQDNPVLELMWGAPGTMLLALTMHEWTGESSWQQQFVEGARCLRRALQPDESGTCELWSQLLYGERSKLLGAVHGFAGNAYVLIRGRHLLGTAEWKWWEPRIVQAMRATARTEDGLTNWAPSFGIPRKGRSALLVQHCHGAPGIIISLADLPGAECDALLRQAGELTWRAGPLRKGSNLCHGTAGNGYAFLKLYVRTGEPEWLERARSFAMHAIGQCEADHRHYGHYRYSLWTGDIGLAFFLYSCLQGTAHFPTLDLF
jgi:lantibiotic modifying enzyme